MSASSLLVLLLVVVLLCVPSVSSLTATYRLYSGDDCDGNLIGNGNVAATVISSNTTTVDCFLVNGVSATVWGNIACSTTGGNSFMYMYWDAGCVGGEAGFIDQNPYFQCGIGGLPIQGVNSGLILCGNADATTGQASTGPHNTAENSYTVSMLTFLAIALVATSTLLLL